MRHPIISILSVLITLLALSAPAIAQTDLSTLAQYNEASLNHQQTAMLTLGGWAVANIGVGLALRGNADEPTKHFHEMNALWNGVNLAIAGFGYYSSLQADPAAWDLATSLQKHGSFQKVLLFNTGLDVGYVLGGLYLTERARRPGANGDRLKGFGRSIMLQGGFLFVFDLANYLIATQLNGASQLLSGLVLGGSGDGLGVILRF